MVNNGVIQEDVKQRIRQAATAEFMNKGLEGARMQDIADAAKINKAMLHYYFRNKQQLFEMIYAEKIQQVFTAMDILLQKEVPFEERLFSFIEKEIQIVSSFPSLPVFVLHELRNDPGLIHRNLPDSMLTKKMSDVRDMLTKEIDSGTIDEVSVEDFLMNCISLCIYPIIAQPVFSVYFQLSPEAYSQFILNRPAQVTRLIMQSLKQKTICK